MVAWFWDVKAPPIGYLMVLPALFLAGLMLGALGLLLSSLIKQLENFAGVMNCDFSDVFRLAGALPAVARRIEPLLFRICQLNPFTYAALICFAFYGQIEWTSLAVVKSASRQSFLAAAIIAYDPSRGLVIRKQDTGGNG